MDDNISKECRSEIMRRVHGIWFVRRVLPFVLGEIAVFAVAISVIANQVFVERVVDNIAAHTSVNSVFSLWGFSTYAFMNAEIMVQMAAVGVLAVGLCFALHCGKAFKKVVMVQKRNFSHA